MDRVIRTESWESEFACLSFVAFLFIPRLQSEALPLHSALEEERLLSSDPPSNAAVIGLRELNGQQRLILKLARRKNERGGYTATRPCFCRESALLPKHNFPIHFFWAAMLEVVPPGAPLLPRMGNKNINRILRAAFTLVGIPEKERYTSHFPRRGAANDILHSGPTLSGILRTGGWESNSFRAYLDIQRAEESSMRVALEGEDSPSIDCISFASSSATKTPPAKQRKHYTLPFFPAYTNSPCHAGDIRPRKPEKSTPDARRWGNPVLLNKIEMADIRRVL